MTTRLPVNRVLLASAITSSTVTPAEVDALIAAALVPYATTSAVTASINSALASYSTTAQMTSAIATALTPYYTAVQTDAAITAALSSVSTTPPGVYIRTNGATLTTGFGRTGSTTFPVVNSGGPAAGEVGYQRAGVGIYNISFGTGITLPALNSNGYQLIINGNNGSVYQSTFAPGASTAGTIYVMNNVGALADPGGDTVWSLMCFGLPT